MADTIDWPGASGRNYKYWFVASMEKPSMKGEPGNYMYVKSEPGGWVPVYIGQTGDLSQRLPNHPELPCVKRNGGTHLMAHTSAGGDRVRRDEEADLIQAWDPPCNG